MALNGPPRFRRQVEMNTYFFYFAEWEKCLITGFHKAFKYFKFFSCLSYRTDVFC